VSLEIWWPGGSRPPQKFSRVSKNNFLEIKEFAMDYTILDKHPFRLGGAKSRFGENASGVAARQLRVLARGRKEPLQ
jgi:hypothetical protein